MNNQKLADIFDQMADIMEILGEDSFRVNTYRKVARMIHDQADDIVESITPDRFVSEVEAAPDDKNALNKIRMKKLTGIAGLGKSTAEKIIEYADTGRMTAHLELLEKIPNGLLELLDIPGFGPKGVAKVWKELKVENLDNLQRAINDKSLEKLSGFGPKKAQAIAKGITFVNSSKGRINIDEAIQIADLVVGQLRLRLPAIKRIELTGSLRRCRETIGDIDLLAQIDPDNNPELGKDTVEAFTTMPGVQNIIAAGESKASIRYYHQGVSSESIQVDLRLVPDASIGAAQQYFTGSKEHNVRLREIAGKKNLKLNEYGLFKGERQVAGDNEPDIYRKLGMAYVHPTMREDRGEIQAAQKKKLPKLIQPSDIRGDLHMHTPASDGRSPLEELIETARMLGYEYIAITDHSRSSAIAGGMETERLLEHIDTIHDANRRYDDIEVFASSEVDILPDGSLDYDDDILAQLDFIMASVHSAMTSPREKNTRRILRAMENPYVNCIGHPTGRMLGMREPMDLDMKAIIEQAVRTGTAMEISSQPLRLDLKDVHIKMAVEAGGKMIINTDAHDAGGLQLIRYGVATAQRGWAEKKDILNTLPLGKFQKWVRAKRENA